MAITTAAPWTEFFGIRDGSVRERIFQRTPVPSHLALIYTYAQKGNTDLNLVVGDLATWVYGDQIFDVRSKFATHQTVLAELINRTGNAIMVKRVIPKDAPPAANVRISVELVKTQIDPMARLSDGQFDLDQDGNTKPSGTTIEGHKVKFVAEYITPGSDGESKIGKGVKRTGTLEGNNQEESQRIPLFDFEVSSQGAWGNLQGIRIWAEDINGAVPVNDSLVSKYKAYPYFFSFVEKASEDATARTVYADTGEQHVQLVLKPDVFDLNTDSDYYVGSELLRRWAMPNSSTHIKPVGPFGRLHVYDQNLEEIHKALAATEKAALSTYAGMDHDLVSTDDDDHFRFNLFGGFTTRGVPYISYQIEKTSPVSTERVLRFTEKSNIMATGGGDGTMSPELFAELVGEEVQAFGDRNSKYQDLIRYPISVFYDTGFPMETKRQIGKLISVRKDVCVALVPSVFGQREPTPSEESSICIALRTILQASPESSHFGTPVVRGMVFAHTGRLLSSRWRHRAPLVMEVAYKFARYMGASDGIWKTEYAPDSSGNNRVEMFGEISEAYKPASVRNRDWKTGMVWVDACDLDKFYWPALRTVYEDDSSVLTSALTMFACCELEKVGDRVRTNYSGNTRLSNGQLKERIENEVSESVRGRFDNRFEITPTVDFTKADIARGYSWLLKIAVRARLSRTVQLLYIEALRFEEDDQPTTSFNI